MLNSLLQKALESRFIVIKTMVLTIFPSVDEKTLMNIPHIIYCLNLNLSFQVVWHCHMPVGSQLIYLQTESHNYHMPHEEYTKSIQNVLPKLLLRRRILILPVISGFAYGPYLPDKSSSCSHLNGS